MNIEFPCPQSLDEMQENEKGYHCNQCNEQVYVISELHGSKVKENVLFQSNKCYRYLTSKPNENIFSIRKFALALMIVFGSGIFIFANDQLEKNLKIVSEKLEIYPTEPTTVLVSVFDRQHRIISANVKVELPNGHELEAKITKSGIYQIELPSYVKGKEIIIYASRRGKAKKEKVLVHNLGDVIDVDFIYRRKKITRVYSMTGCPSF